MPRHGCPLMLYAIQYNLYASQKNNRKHKTQTNKNHPLHLCLLRSSIHPRRPSPPSSRYVDSLQPLLYMNGAQEEWARNNGHKRMVMEEWGIGHEKNNIGNSSFFFLITCIATHFLSRFRLRLIAMYHWMRRDRRERYWWRRRGGGINVSILENKIKNDDFFFWSSSFSHSFHFLLIQIYYWTTHYSPHFVFVILWNKRIKIPFAAIRTRRIIKIEDDSRGECYGGVFSFNSNILNH